MIQKNLSAWITDSQGNQLPEYKSRETEDNAVECWIRSKEGENFRIKWQPTRDFEPKLGLRCSVCLDGRAISARVLYPSEIARGVIGDKDGMTVGPGLKRKLVFGSQNLTDQDELASPDDPDQADLGTIRVVLKWVHVDRKQKVPVVFQKPSEAGFVHERAAKKGHGAAVGLGEPVPARLKPVMKWLKIDAGLPVATFVFRYGPKEWLKAKDIILNTSPEPPSRGRAAQPGGSDKKRKRESSPAPTTQGTTKSSPKVPPQKHIRMYDPSEVIDIDDLETDDDSDFVVLSDPVVLKTSRTPVKLEKKAKREESDATLA